jgi:hypothetical protein
MSIHQYIQWVHKASGFQVRVQVRGFSWVQLEGFSWEGSVGRCRWIQWGDSHEGVITEEGIKGLVDKVVE